MRFSHEVTTGISHGREPVVSKKVGRKVPKGRQADELTRLPVVLSGLKTTRRNLLHGLAPVSTTYRHFVTETHCALQRILQFNQCFCFSKSFTALGEALVRTLSTRSTGEEAQRASGNSTDSRKFGFGRRGRSDASGKSRSGSSKDRHVRAITSEDDAADADATDAQGGDDGVMTLVVDRLTGGCVVCTKAHPPYECPLIQGNKDVQREVFASIGKARRTVTVHQIEDDFCAPTSDSAGDANLLGLEDNGAAQDAAADSDFP